MTGWPSGHPPFRRLWRCVSGFTFSLTIAPFHWRLGAYYLEHFEACLRVGPFSVYVEW